MKIKSIVISISLTVLILLSFTHKEGDNAYQNLYFKRISAFKAQQIALLTTIKNSDLNNANDVELIQQAINKTRLQLKGLDFWFRYLEPVVYKKINGPLPVEWETEVFEKFEKPYKREGAGLTLAFQYLEETNLDKEKLYELVKLSIDGIDTYVADSITKELNTYHHFYLSNRLYLLNLAAIYSTGFECPDTSRIIPELKLMLSEVNTTYKVFNESFSGTALSPEYMSKYQAALEFVNLQSDDYSRFDHFTFIRDYVNPLFDLNHHMILNYQVVTKSFIDFSLNQKANTIFTKSLYRGQETKGIFSRVTDKNALAEIENLGRLLFYDPLLSGNNERSCASCHSSSAYFTDTTSKTALDYNKRDYLKRNTPSLINANANHLVMLDGKHISLQDQVKDVITNSSEMGGVESEILEKILSCKTYKNGFKKLLKYTPQEKDITFSHITSVITAYYSKFSNYNAPFDDAMNKQASIDNSVVRGFNLFMSKAQCATCHFVPQFNGVKPPYVGSEFEVLGVPADTGFLSLSEDKGRYLINPAYETANAFRTGSIRNSAYTKPYMHNGVYRQLEEVIDFYNAGGGAGRGLKVENQTLSSDSLGLSSNEKQDLIKFINALNEAIPFEPLPKKLPESKHTILNNRRVGGTY